MAMFGKRNERDEDQPGLLTREEFQALMAEGQEEGKPVVEEKKADGEEVVPGEDEDKHKNYTVKAEGRRGPKYVQSRGEGEPKQLPNVGLNSFRPIQPDQPDQKDSNTGDIALEVRDKTPSIKEPLLDSTANSDQTKAVKNTDTTRRLYTLRHAGKVIGWGIAIIGADVACTPFFMGGGIAGIEISSAVFSMLRNATSRQEIEKIIVNLLNENIIEAFSNHSWGVLAPILVGGFFNLTADMTTITVTDEMSRMVVGKFGGDFDKGWQKGLYVFSNCSGFLHYNSLASPDGAMIYALMRLMSDDAAWVNNPVTGIISSQIPTVFLGKPYYYAIDDKKLLATIKAIEALKRHYEDWSWLAHIPELMNAGLDSAAVLTYRLLLGLYSNNSYWLNVAGLPHDNAFVLSFGIASTISGFIRIATTRLVGPIQEITKYKQTLLDVCKLQTRLDELRAEFKEDKLNKAGVVFGLKILASLMQVTGAFVIIFKRGNVTGAAITSAFLLIMKIWLEYKTYLCKEIERIEKAHKIVSTVLPKKEEEEPVKQKSKENEPTCLGRCPPIDPLHEIELNRKRSILSDLKDKRNELLGIDGVAYGILAMSRFFLRLPAQPANVAAMNISWDVGLAPEELIAVAAIFAVPNALNEIVNFSPCVGESISEYLVRRDMERVLPYKEWMKTNKGVDVPFGGWLSCDRGKFTTFIEEYDLDYLEEVYDDLVKEYAKKAAENAKKAGCCSCCGSCCCKKDNPEAKASENPPKSEQKEDSSGKSDKKDKNLSEKLLPDNQKDLARMSFLGASDRGSQFAESAPRLSDYQRQDGSNNERGPKCVVM